MPGRNKQHNVSDSAEKLGCDSHAVDLGTVAEATMAGVLAASMTKTTTATKRHILKGRDKGKL